MKLKMTKLRYFSYISHLGPYTSQKASNDQKYPQPLHLLFPTNPYVA